MASAHALILAKNLLTGAAEGLTDAAGNAMSPVNLADFDPNDPNGGTYVRYSKPRLLSPKATDMIFTAICLGCSVKLSLQMSPDGVNWCDCVLADGGVCKVECDPLVQNCYVQPIDVGVLQYVRFKIYEVSSSSGDCTISLNFTLD